MSTPNLLRSRLGSLTNLASNDLSALFRRVTSAVAMREALEDILPALIETYGAAAATLTADWYDDAREKAGAGGRFLAIPATVPAASGASALAGYAVGPMFDEVPDLSTTRSLVEGGLQRRIANVARETVMTSAVEDPNSTGWQRSASGGCAFCQMLAGRGQVYSRKSADFASHDACKCVAVPAFKGEPLPVKPYVPSRRNISDADRARVREYLRKN
jgi:hypothetical protein